MSTSPNKPIKCGEFNSLKSSRWMTEEMRQIGHSSVCRVNGTPIHPLRDLSNQNFHHHRVELFPRGTHLYSRWPEGVVPDHNGSAEELITTRVPFLMILSWSDDLFELFNSLVQEWLPTYTPSTSATYPSIISMFFVGTHHHPSGHMCSPDHSTRLDSRVNCHRHTI